VLFTTAAGGCVEALGQHEAAARTQRIVFPTHDEAAIGQGGHAAEVRAAGVAKHRLATDLVAAGVEQLRHDLDRSAARRWRRLPHGHVAALRQRGHESLGLVPGRVGLKQDGRLGGEGRHVGGP